MLSYFSVLGFDESHSGARFIFGKKLLILLLSLGMLAGCDRLVTPRKVQLSKDADAKAAAGDYSAAIALYEASLDGTAKSADVHYKLALLYDDKLNDQLNALHHFKRFLSLEPTGKRAAEVKNFMKRDELSLLTSLTGDSMVPRSEIVRLDNENLQLRKQLGDQWAAQKLAAAEEKNARARGKGRQNAKPRTYTVRDGDTLASIARKFYNSSAQWHRILQANSATLAKPADLKPGQTLVIP
jgi:nucleoid-associated protein YgaU